MKDFGVGFGGPDEILGRITEKILNNWTLILGGTDFFKQIENIVYTPGTGKNVDFELIMIPWGGKLWPVALGKKNKDLEKYLHISESEFSKMVLVRLDKRERIGSVLACYGYKTDNEKRDFVFNLLNDMLEYMETGRITREHVSNYTVKQKSSKKSKSTRQKRKTLSKSIRHEVFKRDDYKCVECGATKEDTVLHIDHIIPVSQGGSDELDNLQTLCESCNLSKSNRAWKGGN